MIKRRAFLLALPLVPALPRLTRAEPSAKVYGIGLLGPGLPFADQSPAVVNLTKSLAKRGYKIGETLVFERRAAQGNLTLLPGWSTSLTPPMSM